MNKAIVIGASSGIGKELAKLLSKENYIVGLAARRTDLLEEIASQLPMKSYVKHMDVSQPDCAMKELEDLIAEMDGVGLIVFCSGTGYINPELDWQKEKETIDVNVTGFSCIADVSYNYFVKHGFGHFTAISSVAALRGGRDAPAYNASKAFVSNYMEGLRCKARKENPKITITDIRPGFVDTKMAQGNGLFWVASPETAAKQIVSIIRRKKEIGYVTRRWLLVAKIYKILPRWIYNKF